MSKKVNFSSSISYETKDKLDKIKEILGKYEDISNAKLVTKIANLVYSISDNEELINKLIEDDYEGINELLNKENAKEVPIASNIDNNQQQSVDTIKSNYYRSNEALKELQESNKQNPLEDFERFSNLEVVFEDKLKASSTDLEIPGVLGLYDESDNLLSVEGSQNINKTLNFISKALKKGKANKEKTDNELSQKYKAKYDVYKKFKDLAESDVEKYKVLSLGSPRSVEGRLTALQLIKDTPNVKYNIDDY